ncbi:MAG: hypothetical protein R3C14_07285 [Caldilineaceae bacterium]
MRTKKSHPFGNLIRHYLQQGHFTQNDLADGVEVDPTVIARMCGGERLTDRSRILAIIRWFYQQGLICHEQEATALLEAAGHARLNAIEPNELGIQLETDSNNEQVSKEGVSGNTVIDVKTPVEAGIFNFHPDRLAVIEGYDLWFSSSAQGHWQIWRLDTQSGVALPVEFAIPWEQQKQDLLVPAISISNAKIAFAMDAIHSSNAYNRDLYVAKLDGTDVRKVTHLPLDTYHPSWVPDGEGKGGERHNQNNIVYHVEIDEKSTSQLRQHGIWITNVDTGQSRQLTCSMDYDPVWSPNGQYIAYHSLTSTWCIKILEYPAILHEQEACYTWVATDGGSKATSVAWVNNYEIIFAAEVDGKWDLYKLPVLRGKTLTNPERITCKHEGNMYPAIFGERILLWQAYPHEPKVEDGPQTDKLAELFVMDLNQGVETPLITGVGNVRDGFLVRRTPSYLRQIGEIDVT